MQGIELLHVESSSPTRDWTQAPFIGKLIILATGPPGKSLENHISNKLPGDADATGPGTTLWELLE